MGILSQAEISRYQNTVCGIKIVSMTSDTLALIAHFNHLKERDRKNTEKRWKSILKIETSNANHMQIGFILLKITPH